MLAAFFEIKPGPKAAKHDPDACKPKHPKPAKPKHQSKAAKRVDPYEGGAVHAQFKPTAAGPQPQPLEDPCAQACDTVDAAEETADPYEYLWQEADHSAVEDDDTDSCLTFDDSDVPDGTDSARLGCSPADTPFDALDRAFFSKRKAKASEAPVYSGPELWYEDDDFIE